MYKSVAILCVLLLASAAAFFAPAATRPARMTMLFSNKKAAPAPSGYEVGKGSANKGTYIPEGLSKEAYDKFLAAEAAKTDAKKRKFKIGKEVETLTEWALKCEAKGLKGKDMLLKGHRMVKPKFEGWYTDESPI